MKKRDLVQSRFMLFSGSGSCSWLSLLVSPLSSGLNCVQLCAILERSHPVQDCPSVRALCAEVGRLQHEDNHGQVWLQVCQQGELDEMQCKWNGMKTGFAGKPWWGEEEDRGDAGQADLPWLAGGEAPGRVHGEGQLRRPDQHDGKQPRWRRCRRGEGGIY